MPPEEIPIPIKMSGPFHSPLMQSAADTFRSVLASYPWKLPQDRVIANLTAQPYKDEADIISALALQLTHPIQWHDAIEYALDHGATTSVELGPKNVLTYLLNTNTRLENKYVIDTVSALHTWKSIRAVGTETYLTFLARCLTSIVGTKNYNDNASEYTAKVIPIYHTLQNIYEEVAAKQRVPDEQLTSQVLAMTKKALSVKMIPAASITDRLQQLTSL